MIKLKQIKDDLLRLRVASFAEANNVSSEAAIFSLVSGVVSPDKTYTKEELDILFPKGETTQTKGGK